MNSKAVKDNLIREELIRQIESRLDPKLEIDFIFDTLSKGINMQNTFMV